MGKKEEFKVEMWNLSDIKPYSKNAKTHHVDRIVSSIKNFKVDQPIVVDGDGVIIKGHGRLKAAKRLKLKKFPVVVREDLTKEQVRLARIADNRAGESPWDVDILKEELLDLDFSAIDMDPATLGIDDAWFNELDIDIDLGGLIQGAAPPPPEPAPPPPPVPEEPESKLGDIYLLGQHRVMCGDSTIQADVLALLNNHTVDMLLTDPPYNVDYSSKNTMLNEWGKGNRNQTPILNDKIDDFKQFCVDFLSAVPFSEYNTAYAFISGSEVHNLINAYKDAGLYYSQRLIWLKNNHVLGRTDYKFKSELIIYGWKNHHKFYGPFTTDILEFNKPHKSDLHPTIKPTDLLSKLITDGSDNGALVYDAFGGSGSTIIACEQTGRRGYAMELSPAYVDVIVKRWEEFTGKQAKRIHRVAE